MTIVSEASLGPDWLPLFTHLLLLIHLFIYSSDVRISSCVPIICIYGSFYSRSTPSACHCPIPPLTLCPLFSPSSFLVQEEAKKSSEGRAELEQQLASATSTVAILQTEKAKLQTEVQESKKEQDDLLMLLADQDQKIHSLKQRLKDLGETVDRDFFSEFISSCNSGHNVIIGGCIDEANASWTEWQ